MPSLIALLLAVAIAYFVIPQLAPNILMIVSAVILAWAVYSHASRFGVTEYERATWMYKLKEYSGFIVFGIILFIGYVLFYMNSTQSGSGPLLSNNSMGNITLTSGGGFHTVARTVRSRIGELIRKGRITLD